MQPRRIGLVHTWDQPRRYFQYSYIPRYNETLEIVEIYNATTEDLSGNRLEFGTPVQLQALPLEVQAEINISLGSSGMYYYTATWWERRVVDFHAWRDRAGKRLQIWWCKILIARNWCRQRWIEVKIWIVKALFGVDE